MSSAWDWLALAALVGACLVVANWLTVRRLLRRERALLQERRR